MHKQQFLHSDWLKTCQLIPYQWNFTSATLYQIRFVLYPTIKNNKRNLCQHLLTIENTDLDLKVHVLHYASKLLVHVRLLKFVYFTSQLRHSLVVHPPKKNPGSAFNLSQSLAFRGTSSIFLQCSLSFCIWWCSTKLPWKKLFLCDTKCTVLKYKPTSWGLSFNKLTTRFLLTCRPLHLHSCVNLFWSCG